MLKHHFLTIYRGFMRAKSIFFINLIGLSTALSSIILIYLWVNQQWSVDKFHYRFENIFQVMEHQDQNGKIITSGETADFLSQALVKEFPEIEYATIVTPPNFFPTFSLFSDGKPLNGIGKFADKDFFKIFSYKLVYGNSDQVLTNKSNIVISKSLAQNLYKTNENAIGKTIEWEMMGQKNLAIVSGIFDDIPLNASEKFDFIMPFDFFKDLMGIEQQKPDWDSKAPFLTYIRVKDNINIVHLDEKIGKLLLSKSANSKLRKLFIKSYSDNYLFGTYENGKQVGGRIEYVILFILIAVLILVIACINFVNLSTAQAFKKLKGTGIKRILGAKYETLIYQYLGESFTITLISIFFAVIIVEQVLPYFNEITSASVELKFGFDLIISLIILLILTTLLAGLYPAYFLSKFSPSKVLKGQFNTSVGQLWARKGLVIFQFSLSMVFVFVVLVVSKQLTYMQTKPLGYDKENVIFFEIKGKVMENSEAFISELKKIPGVIKVSGMMGNLINKMEDGRMPGTHEWQGNKIPMNNSAINYEFIELLGLKIKEGRPFSKEYTNDLNKVIYNEAAIEALKIKNPIGKIVNGKEILGVVKNFHFQSLHEPIKPYCFRLEPQSLSTIFVKIQAGTEVKTIRKLQDFYSHFNPEFAFNFEFLDRDYQEQYIGEKRVAILSAYAALMAILISCLGLFGLTTFTIQQRTKEIGIRKVLGAPVLNLWQLLSKDLVVLVIISCLIAVPIAYYFMHEWLQKYTYRTEISWWIFVVAGAGALVITLLTVSYQAIKVALVNPVKSLKTE
ncbi:FtsX-like permease family protein [Arcicella aquatica]|uniref:FtsX-like permease family protein n=1 Tax=Arcicella aquatica TaxID=217141 RepID=A0ABU5QMJ9_9BACT|nr:FtsX-like permease family protein [Arcicella aquatica]MEA5258282.1 FtsX-like permease family protein [Arcicella aquatica]